MNDSQRPLAGCRILVAEDDPLMQFVLGDVLEGAGIAVTLATDGEQAVVLASGGRYDWVLMDSLMPRMGGIEATRRLRAAADTATLCIIGLSGNDDAASRAACRDAGMNDFLAKPVDPDVLLERLRHWHGRANIPAGAAAQAAPADASPGIDLAQLDTLGQGDPARTKKYAEHFLGALAAGHLQLTQSLAAGEFDAVAGGAHRLKSAARWVGARQLGDLFAAIEQAARGGRGDGIPALLENSRTAGADFSACLRRHLESLSTGAPP